MNNDDQAAHWQTVDQWQEEREQREAWDALKKGDIVALQKILYGPSALRTAAERDWLEQDYKALGDPWKPAKNG